jgi:hypothetical protein
VRRVATIGVMALVVGACGHHPASIQRLSAPGNFTNGRDAAGALATIGDRLLQESSSCAKSAPADVRCQTLGVVISWAQVSAIEVAHCGRAGAVEARRTLLDLLAARDAADHHRLVAPPPTPPTPDCH